MASIGRFMNRNCPGGYEPNEVLEWAVLSTKDLAGPLATWPLNLVEKALHNLLKQQEGANGEYFFPLLAGSENDFVEKTVHAPTELTAPPQEVRLLRPRL